MYLNKIRLLANANFTYNFRYSILQYHRTDLYNFYSQKQNIINFLILINPQELYIHRVIF